MGLTHDQPSPEAAVIGTRQLPVPIAKEPPSRVFTAATEKYGVMSPVEAILAPTVALTTRSVRLWAAHHLGGLTLDILDTARESQGMKPNTQWLSIAIEHARAEGAHLYGRQQGPGSESHSAHQDLAKRIWWCCIIRDRLLSLGVRRRIQIDRESFDFDSNRRLNHSDLAGEVDGSGVYCKKAKISLIRILLRIVDLCVSLTDLLNLAHRLEFSRNGDNEQWLPYLQQVRTVKEALRMWHQVTKSEFSCSLEQLRSASKYDEQCKAVAVQLHVMYMYYHSAGIALAHYEILLTTMVIPTGTPYTMLRPSYLSKLFCELQDASEDLSDCLDGLLKEDLISLLPISTIALIVFPLIHHSLDLYTTHDDSYTAKILRKSRLGALTEAMNKFEQTYDGVEWVKSILRQVIDLGESRLSEATRDREWRRNLSSSPAPYLRIAFTIEFSLSRSYFFQEADAPAYLETVFKDKSTPTIDLTERAMMVQPMFGIRDTAEALDEDWEKLLQLQSAAGVLLNHNLPLRVWPLPWTTFATFST
uniref:Xylanolytic transcriptional activator regulatory domain-containing protein n=1 Tax=Bionectria ochroleuca TaxID=29856 RepID=A0A8H7NQK7_BIOOC